MKIICFKSTAIDKWASDKESKTVLVSASTTASARKGEKKTIIIINKPKKGKYNR